MINNNISLLTLSPKDLPNANIAHDNDEETLIEDLRAAVRPAQRVEQRFFEVMRSGPVCISHLQSFRRPHDR